MDLEVARILHLDRSSAGRKLRGAAGWKPNQIRDIAAAYGVTSSFLLDEKSDPKISRVEHFQPLTPLSIPVYQPPSGGAVSQQELARMNLPHDTKLILLDTDEFAPVIPQGYYAAISRETKPQQGDAIYVQYKQGGHGFGRLMMTSTRLTLLRTNKPPQVLQRAQVVIYRILGFLTKL